MIFVRLCPFHSHFYPIPNLRERRYTAIAKRFFSLGQAEPVTGDGPQAALDRLMAVLQERGNDEIIKSERAGGVSHEPIQMVTPYWDRGLDRLFFVGTLLVPYYVADEDLPPEEQTIRAAARPSGPPPRVGEPDDWSDDWPDWSDNLLS